MFYFSFFVLNVAFEKSEIDHYFFETIANLTETNFKRLLKVLVLGRLESLDRLSSCAEFDFWPCRCQQDSATLPTLIYHNWTIADIQRVFERNNNAALYQISLRPFATSDLIIPANFFQKVTTSNLIVGCDFIVGGVLEADRDAFRSCQNTLFGIFFESCTLSETDYSFLSGFDLPGTIELEDCFA